MGKLKNYVLGISAFLILVLSAVLIFLGKRGAGLAVSYSVHLTFWTVSQRYADYMTECAGRYNIQNPGDRIDLEVKVYSRSHIVDQVNKSLYKQDNIPDLVDIQFIDLSNFVTSSEHSLLLYPLNSLREKGDGIDQTALDAFSFNDILLALPYGSNKMVLYVNRELKEKYAITESSFATWETLSGLYRSNMGNQAAVFPVDITNCDMILAMVLQLCDDIGNTIAEPQIESERYSEVESFLDGMIRNGSARIPEGFDIYNREFFNEFERGEYLCLAAPIEYSSELISNMPGMAGKIEIYPLPVWTHGSEKDVYIPQYGTAVLGASGKINQAKKFLQFAKLASESTVIEQDRLCVCRLHSSNAFAPDSDAFYSYFGNVSIPLNRGFRTYSGSSTLPDLIAERAPLLISD